MATNNWDISGETDLERNILQSDVFEIAASFGHARKGHEEAEVGIHIKQILDFIDKKDWQKYRSDLRLLALLHDLGKYRVEYSEKGHVIGKGHSQHSLEISRELLSDERLLGIIGIHDKYIQFYKASESGKFKPAKFITTYSGIDLETMTRFNYADSNNREKNSVVWFENKCHDLGLKVHGIYEQEPGVLK